MKRLLPYAFTGLKHVVSRSALSVYNPIGPKEAIASLGKGVLQQFSFVFSNVLQALAENDRYYLKNIMENKLYQATIKCLDNLKEKDLRLKYYQSEAAKQRGKPNEHFSVFDPQAYIEQDLSLILDARGLFGLRINRVENENRKYLKIPSTQQATRKYFIDLKNPLNVVKNQILVLNVIFNTSRRLWVVNEDDEIVEGVEDVTKWLNHKWRFETYVPNLEWMLTDIDEFLEGNPYQNKEKK